MKKTKKERVNQEIFLDDLLEDIKNIYIAFRFAIIDDFLSENDELDEDIDKAIYTLSTYIEMFEKPYESESKILTKAIFNKMLYLRELRHELSDMRDAYIEISNASRKIGAMGYALKCDQDGE